MPRLNLYEQQTSAQGPRSSGADFGAAPAQALVAAAKALRESTAKIISANKKDMDRGAANGLTAAMLAPLPRCRTTVRPAAALRSCCGRTDAMYSYDRPWKP